MRKGILAASAVVAILAWFLADSPGRTRRKVTARRPVDARSVPHVPIPRSGPTRIRYAKPSADAHAPPRTNETARSFLNLRCEAPDGRALSCEFQIYAREGKGHWRWKAPSGTLSKGFDLPPGFPVVVQAIQYDEDEVRALARTTATQTQRPLTLVICDPIEVHLRVVDEEQRPISGAGVDLHPTMTGPDYSLKLDGGYRQATNVDGGCILDVRSGQTYSIGAHARGYLPIRIPNWTAPADGSDTVVTLRRGIRVTGRMVRNEGAAPERLTLRVSGVRYEADAIDDEGRFELIGLTPGDYTFTVLNRSRFPVAYHATRIDADADLGNLAMSGFRSARVRLVGPGGAPLEGTLVVLPGQAPIRIETNGTRTMLPKLPEAWIVTRVQGYERRWYRASELPDLVVLARGEQVVLHLPTDVSGTVYYFGRSVQLSPEGAPATSVVCRSSASDGTLRIELPGLAPGRWTIVVDREPRTFEVIRGQPNSIRFKK